MIDHRQDHFKDSGPSMEPWQPPGLTSAQEEVCPLRTTLSFLFLKKLGSRFKRLPDMSFCFSLKIIPSCDTLSKTLDISRNTLRTTKPSSNDWYIWRVIDRSWLMQSPGLKLDGCWEIRSFSIKNTDISLNINRSRISLRIGSKDIGR